MKPIKARPRPQSLLILESQTGQLVKHGRSFNLASFNELFTQGKLVVKQKRQPLSPDRQHFAETSLFVFFGGRIKAGGNAKGLSRVH